MTLSASPRRPVLRGATDSPHDAVRSALALLDGDGAALRAVAAELAGGLSGGADDVRAERADRLLYATDASIYEMEPVAVVFPRSAADVQHVLRVAGRHGVAVLPRGGGTSLAGQGVNHAIVLDFTPHMGRVLSIDPATRTARVQPGVVLTQLGAAARAHGLLYPVDPSTANRATIGGGIGNNSCGAHSGLYGKTADNVIAIEAVLADGSLAMFEPLDAAALAGKRAQSDLEGAIYRATEALATAHAAEIERRFPDIPRRVSGYNLDAVLRDPGNLVPLIVGSEGTLAVATEATVRLVPTPAFTGLAALHFDSVVAAAEAVMPVLAHRPSAAELIGSTIIERCRAHPGLAPLAAFVRGDPGALLVVEFYGDDAAAVRERLDALTADLAARGLCATAVTTTDPAEQAAMWRLRTAGLGLLMSVKGDAKPVAFVEDTAVAPQKLAGFVARFDAIVEAHGARAGYYGHAGEGCLHIRPEVNLKRPDGLAMTARIASQIADLVVEFGGSLSGEHGDGIVRGVFMERLFGRALIGAFRDLKRAFDPQGLLNPGKIIDTPPFEDNLRLGPETVNETPATLLDFRADGGLAGALEQCNGQGACRKFDGAMCPSFMVTRDEEHSTRGRANLLRQALNGGLPAADLTGDRVAEALDLCVECKACKAECPSGVDMAKIKYEVLSQRYAEHGVPLRDRAFARVGALGRWGSRTAPLANRLATLRPARALLHRWGGVHRDRQLPRFARQTFPRWFDARAAPDAPAPRGEAVLFHDTFTDYFHPEVGVAATAVLEALGYRVRRVAGRACCGRPAISRGQLPLARDWARRNVDALRPLAARGLPIVGTEPSCLLTLREEWLDLVPGPDARLVADRAVLLDELVASLANDPQVAQRFRPGDRDLLVHGHCHQKAVAGMAPTLRALSVAGYRPRLIDAACCGMAGSFGFEAEHYEISRRMGAERLFPALDAAPAETGVAITGVSCRQQIEQFSDRRPRHSAEWLADALRAPSPSA